VNPNGVILLHDISVKENDFGVWKWWDEIKQRYHHFEFLHCNGLGILAVGEKPPEELRWLFEASNEYASVIQNFFFCLGYRLTIRKSLETTSAALPVKLGTIWSSANWKVSSKLSSMINAFLPLGTRRRGFAKRTWRFCNRIWAISMTKYRRAVEMISRSTAKIRYLYKLTQAGIRVILNEGWRSFWNKFKNWWRMPVSVVEVKPSDQIEGSNYIPKIVEILEKTLQVSDGEAKYLIDVVVPIYNAYDDFEKCLYSLFKYQNIYRIVLIDDCSTDKRIKEFLDTLKEYESERFRIMENDENIGYLKTVNKGMKMSKNDVILVNTDTIVTNGFARKMRACAYSDNSIATVTPFTNNGMMCSIPEFNKSNDIPAGFTIDSFAECVEKSSFNQYPELVTAVGFCMYIKRDVINEIGCFDEVNFGKGYGEEGDFSARAVLKGYKNVLCDNTFIYHKGRASFLTAQDDLLLRNHEVLAKLHPGFFPAIGRFEKMNPLKELHNNIKLQMSTNGGTIIDETPDSNEPFEYLRVPAMSLPTMPPDQFTQVKQGWDYVRHATLGLAAQRILRDSVPGDMAEAGVWRGDCARFLHIFAPNRNLYLFDTFEGFPNQTAGADNADTRFADTGVECVRAIVGDSDKVIIRKGIFPDTTAGLENNKFALVSLDLDTYEGILAGWMFFYPRMSSGGYIFIHDYNATEYNYGPFRATTQFLQDKPEHIIEIPDQWGSALIRKV